MPSRVLRNESPWAMPLSTRQGFVDGGDLAAEVFGLGLERFSAFGGEGVVLCAAVVLGGVPLAFDVAGALHRESAGAASRGSRGRRHR